MDACFRNLIMIEKSLDFQTVDDGELEDRRETHLVRFIQTQGGRGGGWTPYNGLCEEGLPERGTFGSFQVSGNCPPTPPLSNINTYRSSHLMQNGGLGEG